MGNKRELACDKEVYSVRNKTTVFRLPFDTSGRTGNHMTFVLSEVIPALARQSVLSNQEERGLSNYWGYNTIGFFALHATYASQSDRGRQVGEFKTMVKTLHREAVEVILAVAYRLTGSSDLYERTGRRPYASINFVTVHDGFCLLNLVSYNDKHNEANGEGGHDCSDNNMSWNCGVEGPTDDPSILAIRERQQRNFGARSKREDSWDCFNSIG